VFLVKKGKNTEGVFHKRKMILKKNCFSKINQLSIFNKKIVGCSRIFNKNNGIKIIYQIVET
jgi:hypothetical protein